MTVDELTKTLASLVNEGSHSSESYLVLKRFAEEGGTKEEAKRVLDQLHQEANSEHETEHYEDLLDIVGGWCSKEVMIWK